MEQVKRLLLSDSSWGTGQRFSYRILPEEQVKGLGIVLEEQQKGFHLEEIIPEERSKVYLKGILPEEEVKGLP